MEAVSPCFLPEQPKGRPVQVERRQRGGQHDPARPHSRRQVSALRCSGPCCLVPSREMKQSHCPPLGLCWPWVSAESLAALKFWFSRRGTAGIWEPASLQLLTLVPGDRSQEMPRRVQPAPEWRVSAPLLQEMKLYLRNPRGSRQRLPGARRPQGPAPGSVSGRRGHLVECLPHGPLPRRAVSSPWGPSGWLPGHCLWVGTVCCRK